MLDTVRRLVTAPETADPTAEMSLRVWLSELFRVDRAEYMYGNVDIIVDHLFVDHCGPLRTIFLLLPVIDDRFPVLQ